MRWASSGPSAAILTKPVSTPAMSLSRSHRLTWTMSRASCGGGGPSAMRSVWCRTVPCEPSRRSKWTGPSRSRRSTNPTVARTAPTVRWIEFAVLGGERVDRRRDDRRAGPGPPNPARRPRARTRRRRPVRCRSAGTPTPCRSRRCSCRARRGSATPPGRRRPGGRRPCPRSGGRGAARCRAASIRPSISARLLREHPFVAGALVLAERTAVAPVAVQQVVQALRDGEELRARRRARATGSRSARHARRRAGSGASRRRHHRAPSR